MHASEYQVPDEIRAFGWALLTVHLRKLHHLTEQAELGGKKFPALNMARSYLEQLMEDGPDDPTFNEWCTEALECTDYIMDYARRPLLAAVEGDREVEATPPCASLAVVEDDPE